MLLPGYHPWLGSPFMFVSVCNIPGLVLGWEQVRWNVGHMLLRLVTNCDSRQVPSVNSVDLSTASGGMKRGFASDDTPPPAYKPPVNK